MPGASAGREPSAALSAASGSSPALHCFCTSLPPPHYLSPPRPSLALPPPHPQDPHFKVVSEEEQEALDDGEYDGINVARRLVDDVRRRKGLRVEEKAVASGTKQRTMSRKK